MALKITLASEADVKALNLLVNSAYRGESSRQGWTTETDLMDGTRMDEAGLTGLINKEGTIVLLCKEEDALLGCVELRKDADKLYLGMLSVRPDRQGKGIGKILLEAAEAHAKQQHCSKIYMTVISIRKELVDWYLRHGYELTGEKKPFVLPDISWGIPKQELEFVVLEKQIQ